MRGRGTSRRIGRAEQLEEIVWEGMDVEWRVGWRAWRRGEWAFGVALTSSGI